MELLNSSSLKPGQYYQITDFATAHYIQYTDSNGDGTGGDEEVHIGDVEPLIVKALYENVLDTRAFSPNNPLDDITYVPDMDDRAYDYCQAQGKGCIIWRFNKQAEYGRDYDFTAVVFRRWESSPGSGVYSSMLPVEGADYQETLAQDSLFACLKSVIKSIGPASEVAGIPYWLDNFVIPAGVACFQVVIPQCYGGTVLGNYSNINVNSWINAFFAGAVQNIHVELMSNIDSTGSFTAVSSIFLQNCTISGNVANHNFLSGISNKTITPTSDMSSSSHATMSQYDFGDGKHYICKLTSGSLSYDVITN